VRIARFTTGDDAKFAIVEGEPGNEQLAVVTGDPLFTASRRTGEVVPLADVRLLVPVIPRSKVVGVGKNYADHIREMGGQAPSQGEPLLFLKPNTSVRGPGDPIELPRQSNEVHYEGELAIVIAKICKDVPLERVPEVVAGYTCANDVTARDLQRSDGQWARAKGFDSFCPIGPYVVTGMPPADLHLVTRLNGEVVQDGRTSQMIHDVAAIVAHVSAAFTLLPADIILTGTPAGVGPIVEGDRVEVEIEGVGVLPNVVVRRG
jgi:2-keto-4-pentenoate hydratase/2-oxohepta-3-ene-1,7-dioic acid hydratase in catechol pathway